MCSNRRLLPNALLSLLFVLWGPQGATADEARVRLTDGTTLRGDVVVTQEQVQVRNAAGVAEYPRQRVARIEWLEPAADARSTGMRRLYALAADDLAGRLKLAEWLLENQLPQAARQCCAYVLARQPGNEQAQRLIESIGAAGGEPDEQQPADGKYAGVPPPPPLSALDNQRLKLSELRLHGPPERINVRFRRARGERSVEDLVLEQVRSLPDADPSWTRVLERGQPEAKLPVIVAATGLKYADRIDVHGHPGVFVTYRQQVLPLIARGCLRSGCHGGHTAYAFRFPTGSQTSDEFIYTSFAMLDRMNTPSGPMLDRQAPEESALLRYLSGVEGQRGHPPLEHGTLRPVLRNERDPRYAAVVEWIASLRSPHPDYELDYAFPDWFAPLMQAGGAPRAAPEAAGGAPEKAAEGAAGQATSAPAVPPEK